MVAVDDVLRNYPDKSTDTVKFQGESFNPDNNIHSVSSPRSAEKGKLTKMSLKLPIRWPGMSEDEQWSKLDSAVMQNLPIGGSIDARLSKLEQLIYDHACNIFGVRAGNSKRGKYNTRRQRELFRLISEKNNLVHELDFCDPSQSVGLRKLLEACRDKIRKIRRVERKKCNYRKYREAARRFRINPYQTGKNILDPPSSITLSISQESLDSYKREVATDSLRSVPFDDLEGLPKASTPKHSFPTGGFNEKDFNNIVMSRRNKSAPGLNMIPYTVYKNCTTIRRFLFLIINTCYNTKYVPLQWRSAREVYIPKKADPDPNNFKDFRALALGNVEGKIFFSLVSRRIFSHVVTKNGYVDKSIQKGCMEATPGC